MSGTHLRADATIEVTPVRERAAQPAANN